MKLDLINYLLAKFEAVALVAWGGLSISSFLVGSQFWLMSVVLASVIGALVGNYFVQFDSFKQRCFGLLINFGLGLLFSLLFENITAIWMAAAGSCFSNILWKLKRKWIST